MTRARRPRTNGPVGRLNQIIKDEFYEVAFRRRLYHSLEEIQAELDEFMRECNEERTNQGECCQGRTPMKTFSDGLGLYRQ